MSKQEIEWSFQKTKKGVIMRNQLILAAAAVPDLKVADVEYNTNQIVRLIKENSALYLC